MQLNGSSAEMRHLSGFRGQGRRLRVLTDLVEIRLRGDETDAGFALVEVQSPPLGGAVELHAHASSEILIILEGLYEVRGMAHDGRYVIRAAAGDIVRIAGGAPHSYQNLGETPGRLLVLYQPAGEMVELFEALHAAVDHPDPLEAPPAALPGLERTQPLFAAHGVELVPAGGRVDRLVPRAAVET